MPKIAIVNDLHFGVRGDSDIFLNHQQTFFEEIFFPYIDAHNIEIVFDLGDTFDRRKYVNFQTLERAKQFFFEPMRARNIQYHAIVGNHSTYYTNTNKVNSMTLLLKEYTNTSIYVNDPHELTIGSTKFMFVPWMAKDNASKCLDAIQQTSADVLLGHFEIQGFEMQKGSICEHGLSRELFKNFHSVYSGHFHHPSKIGNIAYLGAQYQMTWADHGGKRGFHIFDTETKDITFVENNNNIFHKIVYDDEGLTVEDIEQLDVSPLKNAFVRVVVKNRTNPYLFDIFTTKISEAGAADVKTVEDMLNLEKVNGPENTLEETKSTYDMIDEYVEAVDTSLEKTKIKHLMHTLYTEALNLE